jgi:hypothetical protein
VTAMQHTEFVNDKAVLLDGEQTNVVRSVKRKCNHLRIRTARRVEVWRKEESVSVRVRGR